MYALNIRTPKYIKQKLIEIKGEINNNAIIVEDFNTSLSTMDRSPTQNINKEMSDLNNTVNQMDLIEFRTFSLTITEYSSKST